MNNGAVRFFKQDMDISGVGFYAFTIFYYRAPFLEDGCK